MSDTETPRKEAPAHVPVPETQAQSGSTDTDGAGLRVEILGPGEEDDVSRALEGARRIREDLPSLLATVPEELREMVAEKTRDYLDRLENAPRRGWNAHRAFLQRYGAAFWRILAHKPEASGP